MPRIKLTKTSIARIAAPDPSGKQTIHWDADLRGFGVLASGTTNARTFIVQRDVNGKCRRITIGPTNVLELDRARERAMGLLAAMCEGKDPKAERRKAAATAVTLRQALDTYIQTRKTLRETTAGYYRQAVNNYLADWLDQPLAAITPDMVEKRHASIKAEVEARNRLPDGSVRKRIVQGFYAANGAFGILRAIYDLAAERTPLPPNPVGRLRRAWYPERRRDRIVKPSQLPAFYRAIGALENTVQRDYLLLLLFTGLRRSEAASLTWADVDFDEGIIRLAATKTKSGRKLDLPMSDYVRDLLTARRAVGVEGGDWLFPATSKSGHIAEPRAALDVIAEKTGIRVSPHDLRRGFITAAESLDLSAYALKGLVNHSLGGSDVTGGYVIASAERLRAPMQRVTDELRRLCRIELEGGQRRAA